jgi:hypothetical protein
MGRAGLEKKRGFDGPAVTGHEFTDILHVDMLV